MNKETFATILITARMMNGAEFRALLARLGFVHIQPAPFYAEEMDEIVDAILTNSGSTTSSRATTQKTNT